MDEGVEACPKLEACVFSPEDHEALTGLDDACQEVGAAYWEEAVGEAPWEYGVLGGSHVRALGFEMFVGASESPGGRGLRLVKSVAQVIRFAVLPHVDH